MAGARALLTATQLGVLAALAQRPAGAEELADRLELDRAGTEALLAALAALGYVCADARGVYRATSSWFFRSVAWSRARSPSAWLSAALYGRSSISKRSWPSFTCAPSW